MAALLACAPGGMTSSLGVQSPSVIRAESPFRPQQSAVQIWRQPRLVLGSALKGQPLRLGPGQGQRCTAASSSAKRATRCQVLRREENSDKGEGPARHPAAARKEPIAHDSSLDQGNIGNRWQLLHQQATSFLTSAAGAALAAAWKPAAAALLFAILVTGNPSLAAAAGGGRVGGSSFSSSSGSSARSGGGSSGSYSQSYSAPSRTYVAPSFSAPYYGPSISPWGFGGGYSYGVPGGVYVTPGVSVGVGGGGGFGLFNLLFVGLIGVFVWNFISSFVTNRDEDGLLGATTTTSVVRLQVGLLGLARTLQKDLDRIADRADTSTPEGLHYVLTETVLSLLRHPDMVVYGYSTSEVKKSEEEGERAFNAASFEERSKFQEETLSNVGNVRRRATRAPKAERFNNEYIVVTVVVAAEGKVQLPAINSSADLRDALTKLGSLTSDQVQAVEILWTPQDEEDTLSEREMLRDYPRLRNI